MDQRRWEAQISGMADAYMDYAYRHQNEQMFTGDVVDFETTKVVDIFGAYPFYCLHSFYLPSNSGCRVGQRMLI